MRLHGSRGNVSLLVVIMLPALLVAAGLVLDGGSLRVLSHWITPSPAPRRYDTWFFVAAAPSDHAYVHDDDETVASEWVTADDALERGRRREIDLIYPTYRTLQVIGRFASCADLFAALDDAWRDPGDAMNLADHRAAPSPNLRRWQHLVEQGLVNADQLPPPALDRETVEQLRALGYTD